MGDNLRELEGVKTSEVIIPKYYVKEEVEKIVKYMNITKKKVQQKSKRVHKIKSCYLIQGVNS